MRDSVKLDQKCTVCGKNRWESYQGYLQCPCGQFCWIVRSTDTLGTHFRLRQGAAIPKTYRGWAKETL